MGALKKKMGKSKKPVKKKAAQVATPNLNGFADLAAKLDLACKSFETALVKNSGVLTQSMMRVALILDRMEKSAKAAYDGFKGAAITHYDDSGDFEHGKIAITFPQKTSRSPKWKQEATDRAREIALSEGAEFDESAFVTAVQEMYPATTSTSVKLTVSA